MIFISKLKADAKKSALDSRIKMEIAREEQNMYRLDMKARHEIKHKNLPLVRMSVVMALAYLASLFLFVNVRTSDKTLAWYLTIVRGRVNDLFNLISGSGSSDSIQFTVCRLLIVLIVGAALSVCGALYQGTFKNAMASPTTLGVQSGGVLGGTIYLLLFTEEEDFSVYSYSEYSDIYADMNIFERNAQQLAILAGCAFGVFLIVTISKIAGRGKVSTVALILAGSLFGTIINGFVNMVQYIVALSDDTDSRSSAMRTMMMGTFDNTFTLQHLILIAVPIGICLIIAIAVRSKMNIMMFGEEEARTMGLRVERYRNLLVAVSTVMTAVVISFCGQIGFVGFIVPHITRYIVGPDFNVLIPASALMGGISLLVVYDAAYMFGYTSSVNMVTSIVGGAGFLLSMLIFRRRRNADWS